MLLVTYYELFLQLRYVQFGRILLFPLLFLQYIM